MYSLEIMGLKKRQEAEVKMLKFSLGMTRMDRIRNEHSRETWHVRDFGENVTEARLRWLGHVQWRDSEHISRRMIRLEIPDRRPSGRPKRRFMDVVKENINLFGVEEEDVKYRISWRQMIYCRDP